MLFSERYQHFRERGLPCDLYDSLCTLHLSCSLRTSRNSATSATLDTGRWLTLTRQGLAPCKIHQASLGALTLDCRQSSYKWALELIEPFYKVLLFFIIFQVIKNELFCHDKTSFLGFMLEWIMSWGELHADPAQFGEFL
jgi:hypothetical protein